MNVAFLSQTVSVSFLCLNLTLPVSLLFPNKMTILMILMFVGLTAKQWNYRLRTGQCPDFYELSQKNIYDSVPCSETSCYERQYFK